jgi:uncharacterized integral membrane protein (TIGR00698 family)
MKALVPGIATSVGLATAASLVTSRFGGPPLLFALFLGMAFNFAAGGRLKPGLDFCSKTVLRLGVALLGARIGIDQLASLGLAPVLLIVAVVASTIGFGLLLARLLGRPVTEGVLTGGAVAICGASAALAIAAVLPRGAGPARFTLLTVLGVTTLSTLAMVVYPLIVEWLGLDARQAAIFLGGSIHDVAQVVGAGFIVSTEVGDSATVVKLLRVALLVPAVLLIARMFRDDHDVGGNTGAGATRPPWVPGFLVGFVALAALNSVGVMPGWLAGALGDASRGCLVVAIAALGVKTSLRQMAELGWVPVAMMVAETVFIASAVGAGIALLSWAPW